MKSSREGRQSEEPYNGPPIVVRALRKSYGGVAAVEEVSFEVERKSIFGLIGPDGGGKTTILRSIVSLLSLDSGEILFQGRPVDRDPGIVRASVGYMPQRFSLYQDLTVRENLSFFGDLFGVPRAVQEERIDRLYRFSGLAPFESRRAGALSGGMKQKLALSCMLIHSPEVIVLDEPTMGVDPGSRHEFWMILKSLRSQGTAILVSTAYMDEAGQCDRVGLVYRGRLLAVDSPDRLRSLFGEPLYLAVTSSPHLVYRELDRTSLCGECHFFGDGVHFSTAPGVTVERIAAHLESSGLVISEIRPVQAGLEDLFLKLMKESPRQAGDCGKTAEAGKESTG
jgi:ABC-2 type transport system ATP-binding protein